MAILVSQQVLGYVRFQPIGNALIPGEGPTDHINPGHDPKAGWITIYNYAYRVMGRDRNGHTGLVENLSQVEMTIWKEAYNNATGKIFETLASKNHLDWAVVHILAYAKGGGLDSAKTRYAFRLEDGSISGQTWENLPGPKGLSRFEKVTFTARRVGVKQHKLSPQNKGDNECQSGYDFRLLGKWDPTSSPAKGCSMPDGWDKP